jgi:hypothetical protein
MSKLDLGGTTKGKLNNPYNYPVNNHYTLDGAKDIRLYHIEIHRKAKVWDIEVFERNGDSLISKKKQTEKPKDGSVMTIKNALPHQEVHVKSNGGAGTKVDFTIQATGQQFSFGKGDFKWDSNKLGIAGPYCELSKVAPDDERFNCDFPALAQ